MSANPSSTAGTEPCLAATAPPKRSGGDESVTGNAETISREQLHLSQTEHRMEQGHRDGTSSAETHSSVPTSCRTAGASTPSASAIPAVDHLWRSRARGCGRKGDNIAGLLAGRLPEPQQVALAVAEERATLAAALAGIVVGNSDDVVLNVKAGDIEWLKPHPASA